MPIETVLLVFCILGVLSLVPFVVYLYREGKKQREISHYGDQAEERVSTYIRRNFPDSVLLDDVYLKAGRGLAQIDHILICRWGVYCIETKSHNGMILTGRKEWVQKYRDKTVTFYDPVRQSETHAKVLQQILDANGSFKKIKVEHLVVFTSRSVRFSRQQKDVLRLNRLNERIKTGQVSQDGGAYPLTARAGRKYLDPSTVKSVARWIRRHCETNPVKQHMYKERIRERRIYRNRRRH